MQFESGCSRRSRTLAGHLRGHVSIVEDRSTVVRRRTTSLWRFRGHPPCCNLSPGTNPEPCPDSLDVTFGRALVDAQTMSDLSIRQTFAYELRHLPLSGGETRNSGLTTTRKPEEAADLADKNVDVADIGEMRPARKFDQASICDVRGNQLALLQGSGAVVIAVQHKCRRSDISQAIDHIDLVASDEEPGRHLRRRSVALIVGKSSPGRR